MARTTPQPRGTKVPEIRRGDQVLVLTGKDAGKRGTIDRVVAPDRVVVEGINVAKRHTKPRRQQRAGDRMPRIQQGGILDIAQPLHVSNVMVVCPSCGQPTRVKHREVGDNNVRVCGNCGEQLNREGRA